MTEFDPNRPISLDKPTAPVAPYAPTAPFPSPSPSPAPGYALAPAYPPHAAPMPYPVATTTVVTQQSNAEMIVAWVFTALTALYMLPWAVAATRRSTNSVVIAIATFFLGWTGIGWLVLLILSFLGPTVYTAHQSTTYVALPPAPLQGMWAQCPTDPPHVRRWWDGRAWTAHTTVV